MFIADTSGVCYVYSLSFRHYGTSHEIFTPTTLLLCDANRYRQ